MPKPSFDPSKPFDKPKFDPTAGFTPVTAQGTDSTETTDQKASASDIAKYALKAGTQAPVEQMQAQGQAQAAHPELSTGGMGAMSFARPEMAGGPEDIGEGLLRSTPEYQQRLGQEQASSQRVETQHPALAAGMNVAGVLAPLASQKLSGLMGARQAAASEVSNLAKSPAYAQQVAKEALQGSSQTIKADMESLAARRAQALTGKPAEIDLTKFSKLPEEPARAQVFEDAVRNFQPQLNAHIHDVSPELVGTPYHNLPPEIKAQIPKTINVDALMANEAKMKLDSTGRPTAAGFKYSDPGIGQAATELRNSLEAVHPEVGPINKEFSDRYDVMNKLNKQARSPIASLKSDNPDLKALFERADKYSGQDLQGLNDQFQSAYKTENPVTLKDLILAIKNPKTAALTAAGGIALKKLLGGQAD